MSNFDCASIPITAHLKGFSQIAAEIQGYAVSLDNQPLLDRVYFAPDDGDLIEMAGPYGTPMEDAIHDALWKEARSDVNRSRLEEAFIEWVAGKREAQRQAQYLRMVG